MGAEVWAPLSSISLWCPGNAGGGTGNFAGRGTAGEGSSVTFHEQIMQCDSEGLRGAAETPALRETHHAERMCPAAWAGTCQSRDQCGQAAEKEQGAGDAHG